MLDVLHLRSIDGQVVSAANRTLGLSVWFVPVTVGSNRFVSWRRSYSLLLGHHHHVVITVIVVVAVVG